MNNTKINRLCFSATQTTERILTEIQAGLGLENGVQIDLSKNKHEAVTFSSSDVLLIGIPVYSGRVPSFLIDRIKCYYGQQTPVILVCVYGNRAYDDALVELQDLMVANGFVPFAAAAFVAQHAIFPAVAAARPDATDLAEARQFGERCAALLANPLAKRSVRSLSGNRPYRPVKNIPLKIKTRKSCTDCGACARQCPVAAISSDQPQKTDAKRCVLCKSVRNKPVI